MAERAAPTILCAGGAVQDLIMQVERFPQPNTKQPASAFVTTTGGQSGNAAVAIARLGGHARYAGPLGDTQDEVANWIVGNLQGEGIDCSGAVRVPNGFCSAALIMVDGAGEKLVSFRRGQGLTGVTPADATQAVAGADVVLLDNRYPDFIVPIARAAAARGIPRVLDMDIGDEKGTAALPLCSHVIAGAEALRAITSEHDVRSALMTLGKSFDGFLAVTDGEHGLYWRDGEMLTHMPAFNVSAIDTLGAGDVFHAGFALALAEGRRPHDALRFGSAAAALKCTRFGGAAGAPRRAEVDTFLHARAGA